MTSFFRFAILTLALVFGACREKSNEIPVLYSAGDFSLTDQSGNAFGSTELRGRPYVAAFFFTRCPTVCPKLIARLKSVQTDAKKRGVKADFVTISVDPENDTPEVFRSYALRNQLDLSNWHLLTGDPEAVKRRALEGFKVAVEGKADASAPDMGIFHGTHLILVDKNGQIRGYYRSSDDPEVERLLSDLERLR